MSAAAEIPKIISVDDHVVEPPHVWETWLPVAYRDRGPRIERRSIGGMRHIGGGHYEQVFDDDAPERADCWVFEDLVYVHKRHVAAVGYPRGRGIEAIDLVGPDNVTFETDYPHTDSTWPDTRKVVEELMAGVPQDTVDKVMRTNAARMLSIDLTTLDRGPTPASRREREA